jgi:hypothetical protein
MPQVLTTNASILCPHGGKGTATPTNPIWSVNGGFVLLENDMGVLACPFLLYPCVGYQLKSMGLNATQVGNRRVVLVTDFNQTLTGLPLLMTEFHTTIDDSSPASIPPGQPAPPLSPELTDVVAPVVVAAPGALAFNSTTMQPVTLAATFTLSTAHPLNWILTLINEPLKTDVDVTNGLPPSLVLAPLGGAWNTPAITVTMTMTAAFMASLTPGLHHFYMTGVSARGLSGYAEMVLTVT